MTDINVTENQDLPVQGSFSYYVAASIALFAAIPFTANLVVIVVCIKALRKKILHLLILSLCFTNSLMALSSALAAFSKMFQFMDINVFFCLCQVFIQCFSGMSTYCLIFLICILRYLTVRSFNFGMSQKFDFYKYRLISAVFGFAFIVSIAGVYFVPFKSKIQSCSPFELYREHYPAFVIVIAGPITLSIFLIVIITLVTGSFIWIKFLRTIKIKPQGDSLNGNGIALQQTITTELQSETSRSIPDDESQIFAVTPHFNLTEREKESTSTSEHDVKVFTLPDHENQSRGNMSNLHSYVSSNTNANGLSWEMRAFVTSVIVATMTLLLKGPMIMVFWYDAFAGAATSQQTLFLLFILYIVNTLIDPFIYAWRIPEIRQQFRNLCGCN